MPHLTANHHDRKVAAFDSLPDSALVSITVIAKLKNTHINTEWRHLASDPQYPKAIRLGARCTRFRVGDVRAYIAGAGE